MVKNPDPGSGMKVSDRISQSVVIIFFFLFSYSVLHSSTRPSKPDLDRGGRDGCGLFLFYLGGGGDTGNSKQ
jgi:hypothetical protein